ncbi:hypothetical protein MKX01_027121 [Papaver californicum]|nr:hypothetical protein MKX01_027121 [Papaver californicum]
MSLSLLQPSFFMSKTRSYAYILIGFQFLQVAPPDLQQGGNYRILYVHVPAAWMSILVYLVTAINMTGAFWGRPMWGTFWVWDARLTSLSVELASTSICVGPIDIPIIKFSVNWWNTLHQPGSISRSGTSIHVSMLISILSNFVNSPFFTLFFFVLETRLLILFFLESSSQNKSKLENACINRSCNSSQGDTDKFLFIVKNCSVPPGNRMKDPVFSVSRG